MEKKKYPRINLSPSDLSFDRIKQAAKKEGYKSVSGWCLLVCAIAADEVLKLPVNEERRDHG